MTDPMHPGPDPTSSQGQSSWGAPPPAGPFPTNAVRVPAIAMIAVAAWGMLGAFLELLSNLFVSDDERARMIRELDLPREVERAMTDNLALSSGLGVALNLFSIAIAAFVLIAGIRMAQGRGWTTAVIAAALLVIPCTAICCCSCGIGPVIGVWALVVLLDSQNKPRFK